MLRIRKTQEHKDGRSVKAILILSWGYKPLLRIPYRKIEDCNTCDATHEIKCCSTLDDEGQTCNNNRFYFIVYGCSVFFKCSACGQLHSYNELRYKKGKRFYA